ncbi:bifunctional DNA-formamidopyrimidine glycosylase/DNA-(apurinic or apyrimidinic site) lyase [Desulfonatronovibrio magnus]|uniref:bifunctional DNA-formamidopyrimidine glycosylase/DNA-(apurinic or apyrimidinic site) lyase n=1 Tax=Desulfonatronovibrio magnus TaxID=698827 RepID=UPI0005EB0E07|nr:bifunctional DNA-formamidopyrimidine glycosylase/DNA-(apurinic or apyrimidinic site) lyase [Desulfonatronovibrio magnus]
MPELPEVETIARGLKPLILGKKIIQTSILYSGILHTDRNDFQTNLPGSMVTDVRRRAKLLIIDLDQARHLIFHLKMTGKVWIPPAESQPDKHTHLLFTFEDGTRMFFQDQRKFGYCALFDSPGLESWKFFAGLGPEPLLISEQEFVGLFTPKKARIKALLLDQKHIAGIGNIYADESLFMAGIHPETPANQVSLKRLRKLYFSLKEVLSSSIQAGGSSFRNYRDAQGYSGMFQENFLVYGKKGHCCPKCDSTLESRKVAGRSSCVCPSCQLLHPDLEGSEHE